MGSPDSAYDFSQLPTLVTERLRLRPIRPADRDDWLAVFHSPGVIDFLIDFDELPDSGQASEIIEWAERIFRNQTGIRWAISIKPDERMIGSCGFHLYDWRHQRLEIGYELHSDFWRQGIMLEALGSVLQFCFDRLGVHRVLADVAEGNVASAALLQKAGFTLEGMWRDHARMRGAFHSLWQFGLLAPEYRAIHKAASGA